jgi:hypothetical protein
MAASLPVPDVRRLRALVCPSYSYTSATPFVSWATNDPVLVKNT